jgi:hypothetical protein
MRERTPLIPPEKRKLWLKVARARARPHWFCQEDRGRGIALDEPPRTSPTTGNIVTYITDPWGTRIEIIQRAPLQ